MNLTINGRQVTVDDSFRDLPREDQEAAVEHIATSMPETKKQGPSGVAAGAIHGAEDFAQGVAETAKDFAGVGKGRKTVDPNYVPADVRNGSWNPLNWNYSQIPQAVAEQAPGLGADVLAGTAAAKAAKPLGRKASALAGLAGAGLAAWTRTAGDTAKEAAVARTGDANAEPASEDKLRGGLTAAASSAAGAVLPTRFIPGASKMGTVGAQGALDAVKRYLGTTAIGAGSGATSDLINQAGTKLGTDQSIDLGRTGDAAVNGMFTAGTFGAPKLAGDTVRASNMREFGGDNLEATKNYATRLQTAGDGGLGNAKRDFTAHETVKTDLKNELRDAASSVRQSKPLSPDADNALQRAQDDKTLTPHDIGLIESETAGTPDGPNVAHLARTLRMAQLAQGKGSYKGDMWAGGLSGALDANLGYMLNPTRMVGGAIASSLFGMHLLGTSNPLFAGSVLGGYGGARAIDSMTGMRSPAKSFAEHFADQSAKLRVPTGPNTPPGGGGSGGPSSPWGPRPPMSGPTGPQVAPQAPPQAPQGPWGPKPQQTTSVPPVQQAALAAPPTPDPLAAVKAMLQQRSYLEKVKKNSTPPEPEAPAVPDAINPLMLPRDITTPSSNLMKGFRNTGKMENTYDTSTRKAEGVAQAEALAANSPTINEQGGLDAVGNPDFGKRLSQLLGAASAKRRAEGPSPGEVSADREAQSQAKEDARAAKDQARAEAQAQTATERAQAKAERARVVAENAAAKAEQVKAKEAAKAEQVKAKADAVAAKEASALANAKLKAAAAATKAARTAAPASLGAAATPRTITKSNGKVEADAPQAPKAKPFEPFEEGDMVYPKGVTAKQYAAHEKARYGAGSPRYEQLAERSAKRRINAASELSATFPQYKPSFEGLLRQLHEIGNHPEIIAAAVEHYASHVPDDVGNAMREAFK